MQIDGELSLADDLFAVGLQLGEYCVWSPGHIDIATDTPGDSPGFGPGTRNRPSAEADSYI